MEHDSVWSAPDDMDNYLNDIWTNADLEPPNLFGEIMYSDINDQSAVRHMSSMREDFVTNGINFCSLINSKLSAGQSAGGLSRENVVIKEKGIAEGSNLRTLVSSQSAGGPSNEKFVPQEEIQAEVSKLCALVNNEISCQNKGGLHHENFVMEEQIGKEVSKLCTLVNNFISSQSESDLSPESFFTEKEIVAGIINLLVNNESSIRCAGGPSREDFVTKDEIVTRGSNLCTLVSNQSAIGPSQGELVIKEVGATEGSSLFGRGNNNQTARKRRADGSRMRSAGGPSRLVDNAEMQQKRMIKNRASAARSCARKLIRLANLEREVERYRKENAMLRQAKWRTLEHGNVQAQSRHDKTLHRSNSCSW